jgi:transposase
MEKAREILRLSYELGLSQRDVAQGTGCSLGKVSAVLAKVREAGIADPLALRSKELGSLLYPPVKQQEGAKVEPDLEYIDREMKRKGVTLFLLWEEYKTEHPDGYMYTQFCKRYREYRKKNQVYLRKVYKAGERVLVDWAGLTMHYADGNEKNYQAYLFVATLPASAYLYTEPFRDMKLESWIDAHIRAFEYFEGVPHLIVPDNTKTAVKKAAYYEPELNRTYQDMAGHYGAVIVPARPFRPTDKAPVETGVQIVERRIIAKLRLRQFLSFQELREAVQVELELLNTQAFQKLPGNRRSTFLETEKHELMGLPVSRYECAHWKEARVAFDYHVALDKSHFYSVSYRYVGKQVKIRSTSHTVEVFYEGERIACHVRSYDPHRRYITDPQHMPEHHRAVADWTPERFIAWAGKTGEQTKSSITALLGHWEHPEQAFKTCAGILRLAQTVQPVKMEKACALAMEYQVYSYTPFTRLLAKGAENPPLPIQHENVRGSEYYHDL